MTDGREMRIQKEVKEKRVWDETSNNIKKNDREKKTENSLAWPMKNNPQKSVAIYLQKGRFRDPISLQYEGHRSFNEKSDAGK